MRPAIYHSKPQSVKPKDCKRLQPKRLHGTRGRLLQIEYRGLTVQIYQLRAAEYAALHMLRQLRAEIHFRSIEFFISSTDFGRIKKSSFSKPSC